MKALPRISCQICNLMQNYRGQANCMHCGRRLNNWHVASQLKQQNEKAQLKKWEKELEEDDGA